MPSLVTAEVVIITYAEAIFDDRFSIMTIIAGVSVKIYRMSSVPAKIEKLQILLHIIVLNMLWPFY